MSVGSNLFRDFLMESRLSKLSVADIFPFLSSLYWHIIFLPTLKLPSLLYSLLI